MKKLFTLLLLCALCGVANAGTDYLVNYGVEGMTNKGCSASGTKDNKATTSEKTVKNVSVYQCGSSFSTSDAEPKGVVLSTDGGFLAGDVVTVKAFIDNSSSEKRAAVALAKWTGDTKTTITTGWGDVPNFSTTTDLTIAAIPAQTYTLTASDACEKLILGRSGNTGLNIFYITVTRTVEGDVKPTPTLTWNGLDKGAFQVFTTKSATTTFPKLTVPEGLTATYSSSNTEVATIDPTTGVITLKNVGGSTTIKAETAATETFGVGEASYTLNVIVPDEAVNNLPEEEYSALNPVAVSANGAALTADQVIVDNENLKMVSSYASTGREDIGKSEFVGGTVFNCAMKVRLNDDKGFYAESMKGNKRNDEETSFVVTPKVNGTFYAYVYRQVNKGKFSADGKDLRVACLENGEVTTDLNKNSAGLVWTKYAGDESYTPAITKIDMKAGNTYTLYSTGTTLHFCGYAYAAAEGSNVEPDPVEEGVEPTEAVDVLAWNNMTKDDTALTLTYKDGSVITFTKDSGNDDSVTAANGACDYTVGETTYKAIRFNKLNGTDNWNKLTAPAAHVIASLHIIGTIDNNNNQISKWETKLNGVVTDHGEQTGNRNANKQQFDFTVECGGVRSIELRVMGYQQGAVLIPTYELIPEEDSHWFDNNNGSITFRHSLGEKVTHYYRFVPEQVVEAAPAMHADAEYVAAESGSATLDADATGSLYFYAQHNITGAKSPVKSAYLQNGVFTGVSEIAADANAPIEYYNLQGVRVAEPANGIYLKRQGSKVEKVLVK